MFITEDLQFIEKTFSDFMSGYRFIMLTQRSKEGGKVNKPDRVAKKRISSNKEEFLEIVKNFLEIKQQSDKPLRIYSSVNSRDIEKAIREFKHRQLDADYYDEESRHKFYLDIKNRWISCLMNPSSRSETKFLIDVEDIIKESENWDISIIRKHLEDIKVKVLLQYPTKSGIHIITEPFNPNLWNDDFGDIKKDSLLLLDY